MIRIRLVLAAASLLFVVGPAWATTFYVDAVGGIDANDGLSPASAWKTVAEVNGSTFAEGDQILFKRGGIGMKA